MAATIIPLSSPTRVSLIFRGVNDRTLSPSSGAATAVATRDKPVLPQTLEYGILSMLPSSSLIDLWFVCHSYRHMIHQYLASSLCRMIRIDRPLYYGGRDDENHYHFIILRIILKYCRSLRVLDIPSLTKLCLPDGHPYLKYHAHDTPSVLEELDGAVMPYTRYVRRMLTDIINTNHTTFHALICTRGGHEVLIDELRRPPRASSNMFHYDIINDYGLPNGGVYEALSRCVTPLTSLIIQYYSIHDIMVQHSGDPAAKYRKGAGGDELTHMKLYQPSLLTILHKSRHSLTSLSMCVPLEYIRSNLWEEKKQTTGAYELQPMIDAIASLTSVTELDIHGGHVATFLALVKSAVAVATKRTTISGTVVEEKRSDATNPSANDNGDNGKGRCIFDKLRTLHWTMPSFLHHSAPEHSPYDNMNILLSMANQLEELHLRSIHNSYTSANDPTHSLWKAPPSLRTLHIHGSQRPYVAISAPTVTKFTAMHVPIREWQEILTNMPSLTDIEIIGRCYTGVLRNIDDDDDEWKQLYNIFASHYSLPSISSLTSIPSPSPLSLPAAAPVPVPVPSSSSLSPVSLSQYWSHVQRIHIDFAGMPRGILMHACMLHMTSLVHCTLIYGRMQLSDVYHIIRANAATLTTCELAFSRTGGDVQGESHVTYDQRKLIHSDSEALPITDPDHRVHLPRLTRLSLDIATNRLLSMMDAPILASVTLNGRGDSMNLLSPLSLSTVIWPSLQTIAMNHGAVHPLVVNNLYGMITRCGGQLVSVTVDISSSMNKAAKTLAYTTNDLQQLIELITQMSVAAAAHPTDPPYRHSSLSLELNTPLPLVVSPSADGKELTDDAKDDLVYSLVEQLIIAMTRTSPSPSPSSLLSLYNDECKERTREADEASKQRATILERLVAKGHHIYDVSLLTSDIIPNHDTYCPTLVLPLLSESVRRRLSYRFASQLNSFVWSIGELLLTCGDHPIESPFVSIDIDN